MGKTPIKDTHLPSLGGHTSRIRAERQANYLAGMEDQEFPWSEDEPVGAGDGENLERLHEPGVLFDELVP